MSRSVHANFFGEFFTFQIHCELATEAAVKGPGDSQQNVPGRPEHTPGSASQPSPQSQPLQDQQTSVTNGQVEELPDHDHLTMIILLLEVI